MVFYESNKGFHGRNGLFDRLWRGFPQVAGERKGLFACIIFKLWDFFVKFSKNGRQWGMGNTKTRRPGGDAGGRPPQANGRKEAEAGPLALRAALRGTTDRAPWYCGPCSVVLRTKGMNHRHFQGIRGSSRRRRTRGLPLAQTRIGHATNRIHTLRGMIGTQITRITQIIF